MKAGGGSGERGIIFNPFLTKHMMGPHKVIKHLKMNCSKGERGEGV